MVYDDGMWHLGKRRYIPAWSIQRDELADDEASSSEDARTEEADQQLGSDERRED
jgi:hypothetical protein